MVSLWWGQTPLDELIEKATSELLPAHQEDVALQFMISDQIRNAMRSLHKRLQHKNPNVQMATLSLTDTCLKNGGDQFVREIASREFMEGISSIVHSSTKNTPSLSYLTDTYNLFRAEGVSFPEVQEPVNSFLLETIAPPEWTDSDVCERCRTPFTLTNRKHHCRNCGGTFCQECSSKSLPLPHMAIDESVRVCYGCYIKLKLSRVAKKDGPLPLYPGAPPQSAAAQATPSSARTPTILNHSQPATTKTTANNNNNNINDDDTQFEEDLKKALELSKIDAEQTSGYGGYNSPSPYNKVESNKTAEWEQTSSLVNNNQQQHSEGVKGDELTPVEMENIELFSLLMHRINDSGNTIGNDNQINRLYTQIGTLQPKLVKNLDEASQRYQKFAELHEKLNMSQRVANSYNRGAFSTTGTQIYAGAQYPTTPTSPIQQQPVSSLYPTIQPPTNNYPSTYTTSTHNRAPNAPPQPQQPMYPSVPNHTPTPPSSQPQQPVQQSKPIEEAPLIDL
ncbi:hypothetical protein BDC45DRAFT_528345 [Circinella umbellata]|nr:hypothetical protein BDC45DRAFT_528345 [Circinella umbellata]